MSSYSDKKQAVIYTKKPKQIMLTVKLYKLPIKCGKIKTADRMSTHKNTNICLLNHTIFICHKQLNTVKKFLQFN